MITLKQHIDLMRSMDSIGIKGFMDKLSPMEKVGYIRDFDTTYPLSKNIKKPSFNKNYALNIEELVLGQFIMIEQIITSKTPLPEHKVDLEILKLIIRPKEHQEFDNSVYDLEVSNEEDILSYDVTEVYWVLENFMKNRNQTLFKDYAGVFYDAIEEDDEDEDNLTEKEKSFESSFHQQWYWYSIVRMLAGEDIHKYSETYMLPMRTVLPEMSYIAQRNKIESARQRQQSAMSKL